MTKAKAKIILFVALSVVGMAIGFFFSGYINLLLSGGSIDDLAALHPVAIWRSVLKNERHRMLTLCVELVVVAGIAALMLMTRRETFESDTAAIAGAIKTPVAIGQGQHGTARWLKRAERNKAFSLYRLDKDNEIFAALLAAGERDRNEVKRNYDDKPNNDASADTTESGEAAPAADTDPPPEESESPT
jgi:type IV secretion system protein VirD4